MAAAHHILIVDDDEALLGTLRDLFRIEGYEVTTASDGLAALRLLDAGAAPEVILLDLHMEAVPGWDFATELEQQGCHSPILVMTADPDPTGWASRIGALAVLR